MKSHYLLLLWRLFLDIILVILIMISIFFIFSNLEQEIAFAQTKVLADTAHSVLSVGNAQTLTQTETIPKMLSDGQFVHGPNVGNFNVYAYLREINSPLSLYADIIEERAYYYSVNPRVLITILELRDGLVTDNAVTNQMNKEKLFTLLDELCLNLTIPFYERLYAQYGIKQMVADQTLTLKDGIPLNVSAFEMNAATFALLSALAPSVTLTQGQQIVSSQGEHSFIQKYQTLFPDDNPLDESNQLNPLATPPCKYAQVTFQRV